MPSDAKTTIHDRSGQAALLPGGLRDQLAPQAEFEAGIVVGLMATFASFGYDRVAPPMMEFEETLLSGPAQKNGQAMFRLMDPDTQRVMGLRADMTVQVARIAETRLMDAVRPLRLSYAGNVVRVKGSQVRPTRQFVQAGVELIGAPSLDAEIEVICLAVEALVTAGVTNLTLDLTVAPLVSMICETLGLTPAEAATARTALDVKDMGALDAFSGHSKDILTALLQAAGPADDCMVKLQALKLDGAAGALIDRLDRLVQALNTHMPHLMVTVDPGESHGFEYKSGIGFAIFAPGVRGELGRGGRYLARTPDGGSEAATGFSVYLDSILRALPTPAMAEKLFLPHGTPPATGRALRKKGFRTVQGLTETGDSLQEARKQLCSHWLNIDTVEPV